MSTSPRFSRKDYVMTAEVINKTWTRLLAESPDSSWQVSCDMQAVISGLADVYELDNARFDRPKFVKACTVGLS